MKRANTGTGDTMDTERDKSGADGWASYHIFSQGYLDRLLLHLVRLLVAFLLRSRQIESFFFIRYPIGGTHVRLRFRRRAEADEVIRNSVRKAGIHYFSANPQDDPGSVEEAAFEPEIWRYGGEDLLEHSLCFFSWSSVWSLHLLALHAGDSRARFMADAIRLLFRHVLGFARGWDDLIVLTERPQHSWGDAARPIISRSDNVFEQQSGALSRVLRLETGFLSLGQAPAEEVSVVQQLACAVADASSEARFRIAESQIHMTANRLGLRNADEIYVSRLISRTLQDLGKGDPCFAQDLDRFLRERGSAGRLHPAGPLTLLDYPSDGGNPGGDEVNDD